MILELDISGDTLIRWDKLWNPTTAEYVNDATVAFTLRTAALAAVSGATGITMSYVSGSNGRYDGVLESTVGLTDGATYYLDVTATSGSLVGFRRVQCRACYRDRV